MPSMGDCFERRGKIQGTQILALNRTSDAMSRYDDRIKGEGEADIAEAVKIWPHIAEPFSAHGLAL